jgi:hypothetical protein
MKKQGTSWFSYLLINAECSVSPIYEVSNVEYGSVYKQIFKNAKLPIGKRGQKLS